MAPGRRDAQPPRTAPCARTAPKNRLPNPDTRRENPKRSPVSGIYYGRYPKKKSPKIGSVPDRIYVRIGIVSHVLVKIGEVDPGTQKKLSRKPHSTRKKSDRAITAPNSPISPYMVMRQKTRSHLDPTPFWGTSLTKKKSVQLYGFVPSPRRY